MNNLHLSPLKYSIMIPSYNGIQYLPSCVSSIISQDYTDYELIISDDHSGDGTEDYLNTLKHPNITILHTPYKMSMTEHWEWILTHARGKWCIFVGQDDGLQSYFFELAGVLTDIAVRLSIRAISSERAYYFWPGCDSVYGDAHIGYTASPKLSIFNTRKKMFQALCGYIPYFILPQMYTTSIFNKSLIEEVRSKQGGCFLTTRPQDANLAAICCSIESWYLHSYIPLGWVGSSPKSAGLALNTDINKDLSVEYVKKITESKLVYCDKIGDFKIGSCVLYFWGALIECNCLQSGLFKNFIISRFITYMAIAAGIIEIKGEWKRTKDKYEYVIHINKVKKPILFLLICFIGTYNFFLDIESVLEIR